MAAPQLPRASGRAAVSPRRLDPSVVEIRLTTMSRLLDDLATFRPTFLLAVPRVFEKVYNSAKASAEADGRGRIFDRAAQVAVDWSRARDTGGPGLPPLPRAGLLNALHQWFSEHNAHAVRSPIGWPAAAASWARKR